MEINKDPRYAVLASGSGTIFQSIIDAQKRGDIPGELALFLTDKQDCQAKTRAEKAGIETRVFQPKNYTSKQAMEEEMLAVLTAQEIDYVVLAGYLRILSPEFIRNFRHRIINTHPSLLPAFKGLDAVKQAYDHGVKVTGCTVHLVTEELDSGPILLQEEVKVQRHDSLDELREKIKNKERRLIITAIRALLKGEVIVDNHKRWVVEN
ncbi:phosphoribosylglycinamide formyltransferase [Natranaerobius thermophilus]|uniref:Phosphoribosylglycinamide formyltransferase n=1 Tax=Natranaerobius thermophilus (strain ATCC BAA-1301 / DSM 18059 / JW/NM-WN-LF) TaxID=457570 RepID=B2A5W0_NATTJ|nr:phosphoribosylglycinamide formyltransferase [Natranaerobius thermophilus]ACB84053.1 phosphoribosylglycinamide formyltransferase [Natranaerobius thermophilus JW/NM-WN-LF]